MPDDSTERSNSACEAGRAGGRRGTPLPPLTAEQQELVRQHKGLVGVHLRLRVPTVAPPMRHREYQDLFQEGCLALVRAAARYDPARHGAFAAYAFPRIRGAIHLAIHNRFTLVRVSSRARLELRKHRGDCCRQPPAHVMDINEELEEGMPIEHRSSAPRETIGHVMRRRYEWIVRRVLEQMRQRRWRQRNPCEIMTRIAEERLLIASPRERTTMRQIAVEFGVSCSRVNAYERCLEKEIKRAFQADPQIRELVRMSREAGGGRNEVMDAERWARLRQAEVTAFVERFSRMPPPMRAETIYSLIERSTQCLPEVARNLFSLALSDGMDAMRTVA